MRGGVAGFKEHESKAKRCLVFGLLTANDNIGIKK